MKHDVFISYSHLDADAAKAVAKALEQQGVSYWMDERLCAGDSYHGEIKRAVRAARALVVLLTRNSAQSRYMKTELDFAATSDKPFLPMRFGKTSVPVEWPPQVDVSQWMEATGQELSEECERFAAQVAEQLGKLPYEPPPEDESLLPPQPTVDEIEHVRAALRAVLADGKVTADESTELLELYAQHRVSRELAARLVDEVRAEAMTGTQPAAVCATRESATRQRVAHAAPSAADADAVRCDADKCRAALASTGTVQTYLEPNAKARLSVWLAAADAGSVEGMWLLGLALASGYAGEEDDKAAGKLFREAAEYGFAPAQNTLAESHFHGLGGLDKDEEVAVEWWQKAADQGYPPAQYELGDCYEQGLGVEQDEAEAVRWYEKAAEVSDVRAMTDLGLCYLNGTGTKPNPQAEARWLKRAADAGCAPAMVHLGECYEDGCGVSQDSSAAVALYSKAAELGNPGAQWHLHDCYRGGVGVKEDAAEALKWLKAAGENDEPDADAQYALGSRYEYGMDVPEDIETAIGWYKRARENGRDDAKAKLAALRRKLASRKERQRLLGGKWKPLDEVTKLAEGGDSKAEYELGCRYRDGDGMEYGDNEQAFRWFTKAAEQGLPEAQFELAECYHKGHGTTMDWRKAADWLGKAAKQGHAKAKGVLRRIAGTVGCIDKPIGTIPKEQLRRLNEQLKKSVREQLAKKYADLLSTWGKRYEASDDEDDSPPAAEITDAGAASNADPSISVRFEFPVLSPPQAGLCSDDDHLCVDVSLEDGARIVARASATFSPLAGWSLVEDARQRFGDLFPAAAWYDGVIEANEIAWRGVEGVEWQRGARHKAVSHTLHEAYRQLGIDSPESSDAGLIMFSSYPLALLAQSPGDPAWTWQEAANRFSAEADRVIGLAVTRAAAIAREDARDGPSPATTTVERAASAVLGNWPAALAGEAEKPISPLPVDTLRKLNAVLKARLSTHLDVAFRLPISARGATAAASPEVVIAYTMFDERCGRGGRGDPFYNICLRVLFGFEPDASTAVLTGWAEAEARELQPSKDCMAKFREVFGAAATEAITAGKGLEPDERVVAQGLDYKQKWHTLVTLWSQPHDANVSWAQNARAYIHAVVETINRFRSARAGAKQEEAHPAEA